MMLPIGHNAQGPTTLVPECGQPDDADDHVPNTRDTFTLPSKLPCHT